MNGAITESTAQLGCKEFGSIESARVLRCIVSSKEWHQMTRLRVKRSPQESQPVQHRVHLAKRAAALDWPRLKDETIFFSELLERKRDRGAPRKRYKDQLKRQLAQAGISHQTWQQEASDRESWHS